MTQYVYSIDRVYVTESDPVEIVEIPSGKYTCKVEAEGYDTKEVEINVVQGRTPLNVKMTLTVYNLTVQTVTGGSISADVTTATMGQVVTLTPAAATGYEFLGWYVQDADNAQIAVTDNKFTMPASNVTISASFTKIWYDITVASDLTGGSIKASNTRATMDTTVTLTATPATGYELASWNVSGPSGAISVSNNTFTMPAGNVSVTATFRLINYSITLAAVDNCTYEYSLDGSTYVAYTTNTTIEHGGEIYIKVVSADGYRFKSWSDGDTNNPRHLSNVVANTSLNAVLERDTVILTIRSMSSNNELIFVNETEYAGCGFTNPLQLEFEKGVTVYVGGKYQNGWGVDRITTYKDNVKINEVGGGGRNIDLGTNIVMDSNLEVHISWFCYD